MFDREDASSSNYDFLKKIASIVLCIYQFSLSFSRIGYVRMRGINTVIVFVIQDVLKGM